MVSVVAAVVVLLAPYHLGYRVLLAQEAGSAATVKYSQYLEIKPGELKGRVLYPDGKTPAAKVPVRVWSPKEKKFVQQTTTDEKGNYKLAALEPGRYLLIFGDRVSVELRVVKSAAAAARPLEVIIPRGRAFFSPEEMQVELAKEGGGGESKLLKTLLIGGLVVTAVAVPLALSSGGGGHHHRGIVSP